LDWIGVNKIANPAKMSDADLHVLEFINSCFWGSTRLIGRDYEPPFFSSQAKLYNQVKKRSNGKEAPNTTMAARSSTIA
jgi:hypothetical protein